MTIKIIACLILSLLLSACGGGGGGSSSGDSNNNATNGGSSKPNFTLQVTDAPIDDLIAVVLHFAEVRLRRADGSWIDYPLDTPRAIDLLDLQGTKTADLLADIALPIGRYDEIRLVLDNAPMANYVEHARHGVSELKVPSGSSSGLKIKGEFSRTAQDGLTLVIDFDLRQSIKTAGKSGKYIMEPVLRMVDSARVGHLRDEVSSTRLVSNSRLTSAGNSSAKSHECSDNDPNTYNAVYVFAGHDVIPADIDQSSDRDIDPMLTTPIRWNDLKATYEYEIAFLPEGDYTLAMTCNSNLDDLDRGGDDLKFFIVRNAMVMAKQ